MNVSGNYTMTAHDIVDGTIITSPSLLCTLKYWSISNSLLVSSILVTIAWFIIIGVFIRIETNSSTMTSIVASTIRIYVFNGVLLLNIMTNLVHSYELVCLCNCYKL